MEITPIQLLKPMETPMLQAMSQSVAPTASEALAMPALQPSKAASAQTGLDFQKTVMEGLNQLNDSQNDALQKVSDFLEGKGPALHAVMLSMEQANLNLEFAVQLRNKVMDAYSEIMRTQI